MRPPAGLQGYTNVFLHNDLLHLSIRWRNQLVLGERLPFQEDVEHERNALEAQQIISANFLSL
jgi:hypothetical protein